MNRDEPLTSATNPYTTGDFRERLGASNKDGQKVIQRHEKLLAKIKLMKEQGVERAEDRDRYIQLCDELQELSKSEAFREALDAQKED